MSNIKSSLREMGSSSVEKVLNDWNEFDDFDDAISQVDEAEYTQQNVSGLTQVDVSKFIRQLNQNADHETDGEAMANDGVDVDFIASELLEEYQEALGDMELDCDQEFGAEAVEGTEGYDDANNEDEDGVDGIPSELLQEYELAVGQTLPSKSGYRYLQAYEVFRKWQQSYRTLSFDEKVILCYFNQAAKKYKASTLWSMYSMLRKTLIAKHNVDISKHCRLISFLKTKSDGYEPKQSEVFTEEDVKKFMDEAPNVYYLGMKAVLAFGVIGASRGDEITKLTVDNIQVNGKEILVKLPKTSTKNKQRKFFVIDGPFAEVVLEYMKLRPANVPTERFFLQYRNGKCTCQVMGKNTIAKVPKEIAKFLKLPNHTSYTGHGMRATSTTILANTGVGIDRLKRLGQWKSNASCERYIRGSLTEKRKSGNLISGAINVPSTGPVNEPELMPKIRKVAPTSVTVESLSQITVATHSAGDPTFDFSNEGGSIDTSGAGPSGMSLTNSMKTISFPSKKEKVVFYFGGQITNFNVHMKEDN